MNKKALSLAITLAMALPTASHALGLGDIQSNSHLNQPFRGKIPVLSASPAEVRSIRVRIASPEVFNRVGIDRPAFLNSIRFRTAVENGRPIIVVSSTQPIHEPFVNFLLEVNWSKGQLLKEYTALLDPPVLMQPGTAVASNTAGVRAEPGLRGQVSRSGGQQARRQQQRRIVRAQAPSARRAPARRAPVRLAAPNRRIAAAPARTRTYRVKSGDTLFKVAKKLGYRGVRTEQMMMALYEANPRAFHRNNVNILKKGALMRRPPIQQAKSISYRTAKKQLAAQTKAWKKYRTELAASKNAKTLAKAGAQTAAKPSNKENIAGSGNKPEFEFKVSGSNGDAVKDIKVSGNATVAELKKQLALASESLAARSNENAELKSRVAELESLLRKKNRLITLKSEQLSELQARLGGETPKVESKDTEVVTANPDLDMSQIENAIKTDLTGKEGTDIAETVAGDMANNNSEIIRPDTSANNTVDNSLANQPEAGQPEEAEQQAPVAKKPVVDNTAVEDEGVLGLLSDPMVTAGGVGAAGLLLGGLWFMRRRRNKQDEHEDYQDFDLDEQLAQESALGAEFETDQNVASKQDELTTADFTVDDSLINEPKQTSGVDSIAPENESKEENILQEADVYLVYGLHDQAESELRKAIDEEPDNLAYRAKLIENFKAAGDKEAFEKEARIFSQMEGPDKDKYWKEITAWGKELIPESALFSEKFSEKTASKDSGSASKAAAAGAATAAGLAVTAGKASPDDAVEDATQFEQDLEDVFDNDGLEELNLDAVLDDEDESELLDLPTAHAEDVVESAHEVVNETANEAADTVKDAGNQEDLDLASFDLDTDIDFTDIANVENEADKAAEIKNNIDNDVENNIAEFDLEDFAEDQMESSKESVEKSNDNKLENTNLNLDIDAQDFDKIMPENHAYKKVDAVDEDANASRAEDDNLLADFDDNLSFLDLEDDGEVIEETQISTKLDLAKAYMDMGDIEGARSTLEEVMMEGNDEQKREAEELLHQTG